MENLVALTHCMCSLWGHNQLQSFNHRILDHRFKRILQLIICDLLVQPEQRKETDGAVMFHDGLHMETDWRFAASFLWDT